MKYKQVTKEIENQVLNAIDSVFKNEPEGLTGKGYGDVQPQFKGFPVKYVLEGMEAGLEPEQITDNVYNYMKYGVSPEQVKEQPHRNQAWRAVPMRSYTEGPSGSDQENMLRFICGKLLSELKSLEEQGTVTP